jgi:hypothetical protein
MPIHFIDNYSKNNLEMMVTKKDGEPLYGEIWVYEQFLAFNENKFIEDETWYLKHNYDLSTHPASKGKVEGQIDFLLLSKFGLLVIEVKGGGLRVDENDCYYSSSKQGEYETQNPFIQAKEYVHTLKEFIDSSVFVYRAIVTPHEAGFEMVGPQLVGYKDFFFSKRNCNNMDAYAANKCFFNFIKELGSVSRRRIIKELFPSWLGEKINNKLFDKYPELRSKELRRLKSELFPIQSSYGYNPERINSELILNENYEILKGLSRNNKVIVQGAPGTGKTVLATKFLAENLLKQKKGIVYCANRLLRSKLEHIIINDYGFDPNSISFRIFSDKVSEESISNEMDFFVFDEAQEYFDRGLFDLIDKLMVRLEYPKVLVLYDPEQTIVSGFKELAWYTDFFIGYGYTHYYFDEIYRCIQNKKIAELSSSILHNEYKKLTKRNMDIIHTVDSLPNKLKILKMILDEKKFTRSEIIVLVESHLLDDFKEIINDYYKNDIEELSENNINIAPTKHRYTTPLKYRGLEAESVYLITTQLNNSTRVQNYVGVTRAMNSINIILWK